MVIHVSEDLNAAKLAPLSYEQRQLWFLHELIADPALERECRLVTIKGRLDAFKLEESLEAFIQRHEIWRTNFLGCDGEAVQAVRGDGRFNWSVADVTELAKEDRESKAFQLAEEEMRQPFDLAHGPLVRALLVRLREDDHRLVLTLHRMIFDDVSLADVFLPELRELYDARVSGRPQRLADVEMQYAEYANRQQRLDSEALRPDLDFWQEYLAGAPTVLELPSDHPRQQSRSYQGAVTEFRLGRGLGAALRELSIQQHVTLPVTLTAAFATLLYRYTGQEDLLVGTTASARQQPRLRRAMGFFDNVAVVRVDLTGEPSAQEVLQRTKAASDMIRDHDAVPFDAVVQAVKPERNLSRHSLVQVLLDCGRGVRGWASADWNIMRADICPPIATFDLVLHVDEQESDLTGRVIYSTDLFEPATITRMIEHWRVILAAMAAEPARAVGDLELLTPAETEQLLRLWDAEAPMPSAESIEQVIGRHATSSPDAVAVVCAGVRLSYRQLNGRANRLARYLRELGAGPETAVGVCMERSLDQVVALLAVLKAGAVYVPLDPEAPAERIEFMVRDSQMLVVLTQHRLQVKFSAQVEMVPLDRNRGVIDRHSEDDVAEQATEDQLAYIIYTSGSTGQPKGVMVDRRTLAAHCRTMMNEYGLGPGDSVLQFSQYSFDASLEQILPTLASGALLVMRGPEIWSPSQLLEELFSQQVTVMNLPPTYWHQAVHQWAQSPQDLADLRLRLVIVGGDRLELQWVRQWTELGLQRVRLLNAYGPTETTITATLGEAGTEKDRITIGYALGGRRICVLDRRGRPVPAGIVGELHIGGPLLARGYLNRPELTSERFIPDPFARQEGARLYRTGDLARQLPDGRFEYVGRQDHQVKIRGYRIELGEVESALVEHPAVDEAVVVTQGEGADKELIAYVVGQGAEPVAEMLRGYLSQRLPRFMHPAVIVELDQLPRLASGKPDRRGLPPVSRAERRGQGEYLAPRLLVEQQLVQIWEDLLAVRPVGIRDNFFNLGGHSLLAAQLVGRVEQTCGQRLRLSTLFARPTVELLAEVLHIGAAGPEGRAKVLPVQTAGSKTPYFFLHGDWTGGAFYCFALARACGPEQPFYVLEPYTFSEREGAPSLESMAAAHIEAMRGVQPTGPYRIGGFCNGGLLAYEMALQLRSQGETVEFLGLVTPSEPVQFSALRAACALYNKVSRKGGNTLADLYLRVRHAQRHLYRLLRPGGRRVADFGKLLVIEPRLKKMFPPRDALYRDYVGVFNWLVTDYRPAIYDDKITFYWAREEPAIARGWKPVIDRMNRSGAEQHIVEGELMSSVTEHVDGLGEVMNECLRRVGQESPPW
jgi:amino acid adenylation domain-containing protein